MLWRDAQRISEGGPNLRKVAFIGGEPKGHIEPFSMRTVSGRNLRKGVSSLPLEVEYVDLWANRMEEMVGRVSAAKVAELAKLKLDGYQLVSLGTYTREKLRFVAGLLEIENIPHPAARDNGSRKRFREGLVRLAFGERR